MLEIRPNVAINKGIAVAALIPAPPHRRARSTAATTAPTSTRSPHCGRCALTGELEAAACIAVASDESPPEVSARPTDLTVPGPEGFARVLEALAE